MPTDLTLLFDSNQNIFFLCDRYVFGITHVPRLEDWPVMPVDRIGFTLMVVLTHSLV